jgi:hypothetical protein
MAKFKILKNDLNIFLLNTHITCKLKIMQKMQSNFSFCSYDNVYATLCDIDMRRKTQRFVIF